MGTSVRLNLCMSKRILMFGWEFPPHHNGGLGVACYGLTKALTRQGADVLFVLPREIEVAPHALTKMLFADVPNLKFSVIETPMLPYMRPAEYEEYIAELDGDQAKYGATLFEEIRRYAHKAGLLAEKEEFDVIHAHDWLTFLAGQEAKRKSGKPLILHVHLNAFQQAGDEHADPRVYKIEKDAFEAADGIIANSERTRQSLIHHYGIDGAKVQTINNAIDLEDYVYNPGLLTELKSAGKKVVLYAGRLSLHKGPEYFVKAARVVADHNSDAIFVLAGAGDQLNQMIDLVASLGLSERFVILGRPYTQEEGKQLMSDADVYVLPSVSEPFGLVALEAMVLKSPTILSKQSGVADVLKNVLKVDFWDTYDMADKIIALLEYGPLHRTMQDHGESEARMYSWDRTALECLNYYEQYT